MYIYSSKLHNLKLFPSKNCKLEYLLVKSSTHLLVSTYTARLEVIRSTTQRRSHREKRTGSPNVPGKSNGVYEFVQSKHPDRTHLIKPLLSIWKVQKDFKSSRTLQETPEAPFQRREETIGEDRDVIRRYQGILSPEEEERQCRQTLHNLLFQEIKALHRRRLSQSFRFCSDSHTCLSWR